MPPVSNKHIAMLLKYTYNINPQVHNYKFTCNSPYWKTLCKDNAGLGTKDRGK